MTVNVHLITPIISEGLRQLDDVKNLEGYGIKIFHSILDAGPASVECEFDEALSLPDTIKKCIEAEKDGADAIVIDCMGDPGLKASREVVSIPVLGPMETSVHMAAMLGQNFSIVTVVDGVVPLINNLVKVYGLSEKLASVRVIDLPVLEIEKEIERTKELLARESLLAVQKDGADVIIFGCTGFLGCAESIEHSLKDQNIHVPVLDPVPLTVMQAAVLANLGITHSKKTYAYPRQKDVKGFDIPFHGMG